MSIRRKVWLTFLGIVLLTAGAVVVDIPNGPDIKLGNIERELKVRLGLDLEGGTQLVYDADTAQVVGGDEAAAVEGVRDVIERRVNAFGVSEPVIQTNQVGDNWRVIVELAGVQDVDQAIAMIGETPLLEFKEFKSEPLSEEEKSAIETLNAEAKKKAEEALALALQPDADFSALANEHTEDPGNTDPESGEPQGGELGFFGREEMVPEFAEVVFDQLSVGDIHQSLVETQFGYHIIKKTGEDGDRASAQHILFRTQSLEAQPQLVSTELTGKHLKSATVQFDQNTNQPMVALEFDEEGTKLFADITERNVNNIVSIYLDGAPISSPVVNEPITDGNAVIQGSFTIDEAKLLAQRLNAGALPVPITLVSQQNVGASLGKMSVYKSFVAGLFGLGLVALFMIVYYRLPGVISVIALMIYSLVALAVFKLIPVTLTLAGVAGFILSIGMAVDANILIFERTKEELRRGKPLGFAIEEGFKRAWLSIRDSNISSLITCVILAWFGTSIIKGFAITLGIGVLLSMFSAITVTRTFLRLMVSERLQSRLGLFGVRRQPLSVADAPLTSDITTPHV